MKQIEKLKDIIKNPSHFRVKKGTRVYRFLCEIYMNGIAQTGFSDRNRKYIETEKVFKVLKTAGVACTAYNDAPRGGACGEHVSLCGKVKKDATSAYLAFRENYMMKNENFSSYQCKKAYLLSM